MADLKVVTLPVIQRSLMTNRSFRKGECVFEYKGELISKKEHKIREKQYTEQGKGSFILEVSVLFCFTN